MQATPMMQVTPCYSRCFSLNDWRYNILLWLYLYYILYFSMKSWNFMIHLAIMFCFCFFIADNNFLDSTYFLIWETTLYLSGCFYVTSKKRMDLFLITSFVYIQSTWPLHFRGKRFSWRHKVFNLDMLFKLINGTTYIVKHDDSKFDDKRAGKTNHIFALSFSCLRFSMFKLYITLLLDTWYHFKYIDRNIEPKK